MRVLCERDRDFIRGSSLRRHLNTDLKDVSLRTTDTHRNSVPGGRKGRAQQCARYRSSKEAAVARDSGKKAKGDKWPDHMLTRGPQDGYKP